MSGDREVLRDRPEREALIEKIRAAIFTELRHQADTSDAWSGVNAFYDDKTYSGFIEGEPNWDRVAEAAFDVMCQAWSPPF